MNELVVAAAQNQRMPHETDEGYCNRIYQISLEKARTAATFGKEIHDAIEHYPQIPMDEKLQGWISEFGQWYDGAIEHPLHQEKIVLDHDLGVAGRCDFIGIGKGQFGGQLVIPDWKTQNVKKDDKGRKKPAFYDSWPRQLAFYAVAFAKETGTFPDNLPICMSVVIDSNEPCPPFVKVWTKEEILSAYQDFVIAAYRWFKRKKYSPQPNGMFSITPSVPMPL